MDQSGAVAKSSTIIQGVAVRSCELRLERRSMDANENERVEYICGASGGPEQGYVLAVVGEDISSMVAACNSCPIPDALESPRSCLNLVPVRRFSSVGEHSLPVLQSPIQSPQSGNSANAYFPCRWFYKLDGQNQPRNTLLCWACPYWFPRPRIELFSDYWPATQKMLRVVNGKESTSRPRTGFPPPAQESSSRSWWQRILQKVPFWKRLHVWFW